MSELPVKEGRLSELHLPEISRDDIVRSLSEIRMPDVDLGKALAGAAAAAHIGRPAQRPRWQLAVGGLILAGVATAAVLNNPTLRARLASGVEAIRSRFMSMRTAADDQLEMDTDDPIAFPAAETAPIPSLPHEDGGTTHADDSPTLEAAVTRD